MTLAGRTHRVVAVLAHDGRRVAASNPLPWDTAQRMWRQLDDLRSAGHMPHVAYYAVRDASDPAWQGLRLDQRVLCPHPDQPLPTERPTPHQAGVLRSLIRRSTAGIAPQRVAGVLITHHELRWVHDASCGGPKALYHLYRKGYTELNERPGPRGGLHYYYRPTMAGIAYATQQDTRRDMRRAVVAA